ncbi:DgyrCDS12774 [Dimorphilus gyrociliatus]|uniref:DgyrCDS12774 n=1 Tax=Dimorphilus gyrociliatus TaxID=2664684 RepID=A0A7I8W8P4_9ANNE|nr:DgyrCDS12774 [Dimorphilus gyrociliatus]
MFKRILPYHHSTCSYFIPPPEEKVSSDEESTDSFGETDNVDSLYKDEIKQASTNASGFTEYKQDLSSYGKNFQDEAIDIQRTEMSGCFIDHQPEEKKDIHPDSVTLTQSVRFESFSSLMHRYNSFNDHWPFKNGKMNARRAALSGFAFANFDTALRCFQCAIGLKGFDEDDDPFEEHKIYSPNCEYNNIAMSNNWHKEPFPISFFTK